MGRGGAGSAILKLRNDELTELSGLFIASVIRNALTKYYYSDQLNSKTIADEIIWLPIVKILKSQIICIWRNICKI